MVPDDNPTMQARMETDNVEQLARSGDVIAWKKNVSTKNTKFDRFSTSSWVSPDDDHESSSFEFELEGDDDDDNVETRVRDALQAIVGARSSDDCRIAFRIVLNEMDHFNFDFHNRLVECGMPLVLTRCLQRSLVDKNRLDDIEPICELLSTVYRCYSHVATKSIENIAGELYPILFTLLHLSKPVPSWRTPTSLVQLVERIGYLPVHFTTIRHILRHCKESVFIIRAYLEKYGNDDSMTGFFCIVEGLTHDTRNRHQILSSPDMFLDALLETYRRTCNDDFLEHVARFLCTILQDTFGRCRLAKNGTFCNLVVQCLTLERFESRSIALVLIGKISSDRVSRQKLVSKHGSIIFPALVKCSNVADFRESATFAIRQLISSETARTVYSNNTILESVISNPSASPLLVARCVNRLSSFLLVNGKGMDQLIDTILGILGSPSKNERYLGARCLLQQSENEGCSFFLIRTPSITHAIALLVEDRTNNIRSIGIRIVKNLAACPLNHRLLSRHNSILAALCEAISVESESTAECRRDAIDALLSLTQKPNATIAKQHNLVASLAKFGTQTIDSDNEVDSQLQMKVMQSVLKLIPYM